MYVWITRDKSCLDPILIKHYPRSSPFEGGTNISIEGMNFGETIKVIPYIPIKYFQTSVLFSGSCYILLQDLKHANITVAGSSCIPYSLQHLPWGTGHNDRIQCTLTRSKDNATGPVHFQIREFQLESEFKHKLVNPKIILVEPNRGQIAGGNTLKIYGVHLDTGWNVNIYIQNVPCEIIK